MVLYSPILRLRYICALDKCCDELNALLDLPVFTTPAKASNKLAVDIEVHKARLPSQVIYVADSEARKATVGSIELFRDLGGDLDSGIVYLPESETNAYSTLDVTMLELCHLLGDKDVGGLKLVYSTTILMR
jgi:hypothetical protein